MILHGLKALKRLSTQNVKRTQEIDPLIEVGNFPN